MNSPNHDQPHLVHEYQSLSEVIGLEFDRMSKMSQMAWRLYDSRKYREAAAVFKGLILLDPENLELYKGHALSAARDSDLLTAIETLEKGIFLVNLKPERKADLGYLLALSSALLYRAGRRYEAVEQANKSIEVSPTGSPWLDALKSGEERASSLLGKMGQSRKSVETSGLRQVLTDRMKTVSEGQSTMARALGYGDKDLLKVFDNGAALLNGNQPKRAERIFRGLVELDGGVPLFHLALASAKELSGDVAGAKKAYTTAVKQARAIPGGADLLADALIKRARFAYKIGKWRSVKRDMEDALGLPKSCMDQRQRRRAKRILQAALDRGERRRKRKEKADLGALRKKAGKGNQARKKGKSARVGVSATDKSPNPNKKRKKPKTNNV